MKEKTYLLHILCVLLLSLNTTETLAQTKTGESTTVSTTKETIVKGIIPELKNQTITIDYIDFLNGEKSDFVEVDKDGKFSKKLNLYRPQQIIISTDLNDYIFNVEPGKDLDLNNLSKSQNEYQDQISMFYDLMISKLNSYPNFAVDLSQGKEVYSLSYIRDYERKLDSIKAINLKLIEDFSSKENIQKSVLKELKLSEDKKILNKLLNLKYGAYLRQISDFDSLYTNENLKALSSSQLLPDFYYDYNINQHALQLCESVISDYLQKHPKESKSLKNKPASEIEQFKFDILLNKINNSALIQAYFADKYYKQLDDKSWSWLNFEKVFPFIDKNITINYLKEPIINKYLAIKSKKVEYINILDKVKGSKAESFIKKIFDDNKGKYIYVDLWAVSCGPCITSFPELKKVEENSKVKDLAFVKICVSSSKVRWQQTSEEHSLKSNNYLADFELSKIMYSILDSNRLPTYALIAPNGDLITNDFDIRILQAFSKDFDDAFNELKIKYEESKK
ncbi:TlpA family protein disulfide reductase [Ornithobacterium rhinotracheale]